MPEERVSEGLLGNVQRPKVEVVATAETGRGVVARERIHKGAYVCEYKTSSVFPAKSVEEDARHAQNTRGMYIMETSFEVKRGSGRLCFDATDSLHHPGRFINHVAKGANVKPAKPQLPIFLCILLRPRHSGGTRAGRESEYPAPFKPALPAPGADHTTVLPEC